MLRDLDALRTAPAGEHTAEPWRAYDIGYRSVHVGNVNPTHGWDYDTVANLYFDADDGTSVVGALDTPLKNADANARRIVACVNYCAGLSTEYLENAR